ncbi:unnamed protein product [Phaedon cochleariae]|uniref:NAD(P)H oxidase (H2O2-forming) n=1 Tax=Phaedon cochleariae TaxID=80249 RepID=A0A9N9SGK6_PHACE|nr:unnamed protein product [Phaedon cochleariae]
MANAYRNLASIICIITISVVVSGPPQSKIEKQRHDGWFNNLAHPEWGSVDSHLIRRSPSAYSDGVYMLAGQNRPSPRKLSRLFMKGLDGLSSMKNRTALLAFFGQLVTSEIVMASESGCPIEMHHIEVEKCDEMYDKECEGGKHIPFHRASYDRLTGQSPNSPREQVNQVTSWIDGSFIYSTSEPWVNAMRSFKNGSLLTDSTGDMPIRNHMRVPLFNNPVPHMMKTMSTERLFLLGDPRTNQNPALLTISILFFRWHNVVSSRIQKHNPDWSDEDIFQKARRIVVATLQEHLPPYKGYKPDIHPGVTHVFQSAAFRFGHSLIPPGIYRRDAQCNYKKTSMGHMALRLCSSWWDSNDVLTNNSVEELLMGMTSQLAEREDSFLCSDVRDKLFGPMEFSRRDLGALNIMRGRDNGLPDYNSIRAHYNLPKVENWMDINKKLFEEKPELLRLLVAAYSNDIENIDVYVGGMLESFGKPGELFRAVIRDQFLRIRDADRFWFENESNELFSKQEIEEIRKITMWDIIVNSTNIDPKAIQKNVFFWVKGDPCPQPMQLNISIMEPCKTISGYDYFEGNEMVYIYACVFLGFVPILCAGAGYGVVKLQNRRRRRLKIKQEELRNGEFKLPVDTMIVQEWLHANHRRVVKIKFGPEAAIHVIGRKGEKLRTVNLKNTDTVVIEESIDVTVKKNPMILIHVPRDHDLVLEVDSVGSKKKFINKLQTFLNMNKKNLICTGIVREIMLAKAETRQRREKKLEHFFREAYALTFGLRPGEKRRWLDTTIDGEVVTVMRTSLTESEFANALGMKPDAIFVQKMFNIVDKDKDGRISFQEFLDTVVLFSRGKAEDKLRIIFDMCDDDRNGEIDKKELSEMLRSLVEIARTTRLSDDHVTELINGMFQDVGLEHKLYLSYDDFRIMMKEYKGDFVAIGLDCKGVKQNFLDTSTNVARMTSFHIEPNMDQEKNFVRLKWDTLTTFLEENRQNIFYLFLFYVFTILLFIERFIHYSFMAEHTDLRHIMGVGIAITRGSAASLSFCYSILLLTMSRNLITKLKQFSIQQYIPLDTHIQFHKISACTALFFSLLHTVGHIINFYHVSTQPVENLKCLTNEVRFPSDYKPGITFWLFQTITDVIETELLPSDVIKIKFYRPPNLKYLSGQWVRLGCTAFRDYEFHSFTLTSAPHENFLSCHIKAQGPWTWKLRNYFDPCNYNAEDQPKILLEGPFGGGNQDWYKFEVAVMVGGGIGVTPYASILNDLVFGTSTNRYSGVACKKVYFLWICPSHKHFEWFIDVLRDVENKDVTNVLEIHIFITQFFHKFDLRTTMLYICENHFQRLSKTSIFTGLKAVNHFGRPDMTSFLKFVQKRHSYKNVLQNRHHLKGKNISIIEDQTTKQREEHKLLRKYLFQAKQEEGNTCYIRNNKLHVNQDVYTISDLLKLDAQSQVEDTEVKSAPPTPTLTTTRSIIQVDRDRETKRQPSTSNDPRPDKAATTASGAIKKQTSKLVETIPRTRSFSRKEQ